ncbi:MAG: type II secretion system F family protein [Candidatus Micrarchaeota archaeon]
MEFEFENLYKAFGGLLGADIRAWVARKLAYAGIDEEPDVWAGSRLLLAILFGLVAALVPITLAKYTGWLVIIPERMGALEYLALLGLCLLAGAFVFAFVLALYYAHLSYVIADRTKRVEKVLPDFLLMVAANLRAGLTPFTAFHTAARPEFGPLEEEVKVVASKAMGSESLDSALNELSERIDSVILAKTVSFFEKGMRSGGHLAKLLETSAEEIRQMHELKREMVISTKTYTIFLIFVVCVITPLLLAISVQFLQTFIKVQVNQSAFASQVGLTFFTGALSVTPDFILKLSYAVLVGTTLLVSALTGIISEGKLLPGLKYFPVMAAASLILFEIFRYVVAGVLAALGS